MLIVISPAKALDFTRPDAAAPMTTPQMADDIAELSVTAKKLKVSDLKKMMDLSDKLAELNRERFAAFDPAMEDGLQAAFAFNGDVYSGLKARELNKKGLNYAQKHLRILSGLYGVLRPLDLIQPYRLEMGTRLATVRGTNLYDWWGESASEVLASDLAESPGASVVVNLASEEYFKVVRPSVLGVPIVSPRFEDADPAGRFRVVSFLAKRARGEMAAWLVRNRVRTASALKRFDVAGYRLEPSRSTASVPVFVRDRRTA